MWSSFLEYWTWNKTWIFNNFNTRWMFKYSIYVIHKTYTMVETLPGCKHSPFSQYFAGDADSQSKQGDHEVRFGFWKIKENIHCLFFINIISASPESYLPDMHTYIMATFRKRLHSYRSPADSLHLPLPGAVFTFTQYSRPILGPAGFIK